MDKPKVLGIIPAREGSKRVPMKNFRPFADTTLVDIAIQQGLASQYISDLVVSSDSEEVLAIAAKYPGVYPLMRPAEYASDTAPAIEYVRHTVEVLEKEGKLFDYIVLLQPSSPLRTPQDIDATIALLIAHPEAESSVSVVKVDHMIHPVKLKVLHGERLMPYFEEEKGRFAAHELPDIYVRNCAVYVTHRKDIETRSDVIGQHSLGYTMPPETSVDINEWLDFEFAAFLFQKGRK